MQQRTYNRFVLGLFTVGLLISVVGSSGSAQAQTTSNGPYYATPSWDQTLPSATRFIILSNFASQAVLDRNTGLVWEKSPDATRQPWVSATFSCANRTTGGQKGWRLPSMPELASLIDPSVAPPGPTLPPGHPFVGVLSTTGYWSATTFAAISALAWFVTFGDGSVSTPTKTLSFPAWCVRGGGPLSEY